MTTDQNITDVLKGKYKSKKILYRDASIEYMNGKKKPKKSLYKAISLK